MHSCCHKCTSVGRLQIFIWYMYYLLWWKWYCQCPWKEKEQLIVLACCLINWCHCKFVHPCFLNANRVRTALNEQNALLRWLRLYSIWHSVMVSCKLHNCNQCRAGSEHLSPCGTKTKILLGSLLISAGWFW